MVLGAVLAEELLVADERVELLLLLITGELPFLLEEYALLLLVGFVLLAAEFLELLLLLRLTELPFALLLLTSLLVPLLLAILLLLALLLLRAY